MARIITTDFGGMLAAMNFIIISEVKKALALLPDKSMEADGTVSLCHIIASPNSDYEPRDVSVRKVWLDEEGCLNVKGYDFNEKVWTTDYNEDDTDWYDITDFQHLISQIAEMLGGDEEHDVRCTERQNVFYSPRKIGDEVEWINPEGNLYHTCITGILAEQEDEEPTEIIYTTNIMVGNHLRTAYLNESAILNKKQ